MAGQGITPIPLRWVMALATAHQEETEKVFLINFFFSVCEGHSRYGAYGMNIGIGCLLQLLHVTFQGNIDDDRDLEIITTYDNHQIQAFKKDGIAISYIYLWIVFLFA